MMHLPKIPYKMQKNQSQVVSMRGINFSNMISDGDMADSKNISARSYPYITTRKARAQVGDYAGVTAMTVFRGKFVVVQGTDLLYDGVPVGKVTPGEKQFAAINTKLVIMPDKKYLDGETLTLHDMGAEVRGYKANFTSNTVTVEDEIHTVASGFGAVFSNDEVSDGESTHLKGKITITPEKTLYETTDERLMLVKRGKIPGSESDVYGPTLYSSYVNFMSAVRLAGVASVNTDWSYDQKKHIFTGVRITINFAEHDDVVNAIKSSENVYFVQNGKVYQSLTVGEFSEKYDSSTKQLFFHFADASSEGMNIGAHLNNGEVLCYINDTDVDFTTWDARYVSIFRGDGSSDHTVLSIHTVGRSHIDIHWQMPIFSRVEVEGRLILDEIESLTIVRRGWNTDFKQLEDVSVGSCILFGGTGQGALKEFTVNAIEENSISFEEEVTEETVNKTVNIRLITIARMAKKFKEGDIVFLTESTEEGNNKAFEITAVDEYTLTATDNAFVEHTDTGFVTIERRIPELDFICESDNRIWGCSNADNTIYASALGDPTNFFDYSGESTDSYAVGVGSEERFTACCRYGGGVLFFKEMKLHKILGSYPAEYALYSYDIEGVQSGCHKSLQIINEVLYYKGVHGVFAFNGSPSLISLNFGEKEFGRAVAGNDGDTYYLSVSDGARDYLFAYETKYGIWVLEDDVKVSDFARIGRDTYMLCEDGKSYLCGAGESETGIEWLIQFTPLYETIEGKKSYSRIVFRLELPQGSYMIVDVRTDSGAWREAGKVVGKRDGIVPVTVPINRCDKFEIRLRGKGKCTIHQMKREFYVGGER